MNKKTIVAFYVDAKEEILKSWTCKVSKNIEIEDVSVPLNTVFSFFSTSEDVNFELVQIKLPKTHANVQMEVLRKYISERKIYCYGKNENGTLVVKGARKHFTLINFIEQVSGQGINIVYI